MRIHVRAVFLLTAACCNGQPTAVTSAAEVATTKHFVIGADVGGSGSSVHGDLDAVAIMARR